jgi:hypothetical protein
LQQVCLKHTAGFEPVVGACAFARVVLVGRMLLIERVMCGGGCSMCCYGVFGSRHVLYVLHVPQVIIATQLR